MQIKSPYRNKVVFLQANHISNLDVHPFWFLKSEAKKNIQFLHRHQWLAKFHDCYPAVYIKAYRNITLFRPAIQQNLTLPVVDFLVHSVPCLNWGEKNVNSPGIPSINHVENISCWGLLGCWSWFQLLLGWIHSGQIALSQTLGNLNLNSIQWLYELC